MSAAIILQTFRQLLRSQRLHRLNDRGSHRGPASRAEAQSRQHCIRIEPVRAQPKECAHDEGLPCAVVSQGACQMVVNRGRAFPALAGWKLVAPYRHRERPALNFLRKSRSLRTIGSEPTRDLREQRILKYSGLCSADQSNRPRRVTAETSSHSADDLIPFPPLRTLALFHPASQVVIVREEFCHRSLQPEQIILRGKRHCAYARYPA